MQLMDSAEVTILRYPLDVAILVKQLPRTRHHPWIGAEPEFAVVCAFLMPVMY